MCGVTQTTVNSLTQKHLGLKKGLYYWTGVPLIELKKMTEEW